MILKACTTTPSSTSPLDRAIGDHVLSFRDGWWCVGWTLSRPPDADLRVRYQALEIFLEKDKALAMASQYDKQAKQPINPKHFPRPALNKRRTMRKAEERRRQWETEEPTSKGERGWRRFQCTLKFGLLLLIDKRTCGYRGTQEFAWVSTIIRTMTGLKTSNTCPGSFPCPTLSTELPRSFQGNCPKKGDTRQEMHTCSLSVVLVETRWWHLEASLGYTVSAYFKIMLPGYIVQ